ncbi:MULTISPECIES: Ppx/GppA phosphatase family protein [Cellulophaga]|uniref:Ppx/GppA phosphatase n=2 Tax=Cellulophaga TaxID=104264 RepID=F0RIP1_CELLC|nr:MULTISPECIES: rod shape-determining protein [Cellulophaga]ADY30385.1 Ppx/GppA phosphatase [Cellulophaga lytica DSM 7489]AIM61372.1 exopolyphosphatase [Cellulophaga lytica]APU11273.1 exopolyphosphatase [Cellulophaga lytica]EWH14289.1 Ppx/GppA phosphatase [Cellulophaga geojensis KL-A]MDO6854916.1 rod shape-determining protein [Cellulophaga lytica]
MKIFKLAAIDIGSNAIRLLIHNIIEAKDKKTEFRKSSLVRVPIRLGEDSFTVGEISDRNVERMIDAMKAFKLLMNVNGVESYMACATSAIREANNGYEVIEKIREEAGVNIEVIDGKKEAAIIASTDLKELINNDQAYLYIDVGGGSTEFTVFSEGKLIASKSFKIGTVRLLNDMVGAKVWSQLEEWIKLYTKDLSKVSIIGSGGNINKLHKMSGRKIGEPLSYIWLNAQYHFLESMSYEDRVSELGLNQDRADVIIPATRVFLSSAKWSGAKKIHVPKIGLSDGMIKTLYQKNKDSI